MAPSAGERRPQGPTGLLAGLSQALESVQKGVEWLDAHGDQLRAFGSDLRRRGGPDDPWRWLVLRVQGPHGLAMLAGLEAERHWFGERTRYGRGVILPRLLDDAARAPELQAVVTSALAQAPMLPARRDQLVQGLQYLQRGQPHLAVPMLINPLEGLFWTEAEARGHVRIEPSGKRRYIRGSGATVGGLHDALKLMSAELPGDLLDFVKEVVYGGPGDLFRHGNAADGWQLRAALLCFALVGWLELHTDLDSRVVIRRAFVAAHGRRRSQATEVKEGLDGPGRSVTGAPELDREP